MFMKKNSIMKWFLVVSLFVCLQSTHAQQRLPQNYIVITFEQTIDNNKAECFYWVVPDSTVGSVRQLPCSLIMYPLYLDDSSGYNRDRCLCGDTISYLNYSSNDGYDQIIASFLSLVKENRKLLQEISVKWRSHLSNKIRVEDMCFEQKKVLVYATPVSGVFADCIQIYSMSGAETFKQKVYVPVENIKSNSNWWKERYSELLQKANFQFFDYTKGTPESFLDARDIVIIRNGDFFMPIK